MISGLRNLWTEKKRLRARVDQLLEELHQIGRRNEELSDRLWKAEVAQRKPARFELEGAMAPEEIERILRGTKDSPTVKAILAHIAVKLVEDMDRATDRPLPLVQWLDRTQTPYTTEERLHDSGRASSLAELLGYLQDATQPIEKSGAKREE